ncbi:hypothetical protein SSPO_097810 [Streptomyces antimycoticus]|uniref:Uncharacterized protein n=1 Tax=Streptomyces antimycoticus TaxID=68175 RepID=A0A499UYA2_9ACTN|nr:hypothetical protein SSPO_097810 [Streptomyces antimycoticus]
MCGRSWPARVAVGEELGLVRGHVDPDGAVDLQPLHARHRSHVRPYGEVNLDMDARLNLTPDAVPGRRCHGRFLDGTRDNGSACLME